MKKVEWKRGFQRVFILGWAIWILFLFAWMPLQSIHTWQNIAVSYVKLEYSVDNPPSAEEKTDLEARTRECMANASWSYVYKTEVLPCIWEYIGAAFLVPVFIYCLLRAVIALMAWLYRGFVAP